MTCYLPLFFFILNGGLQPSSGPVQLILELNCVQDDENALLQQALAMSMDEPAAAASVATRDIDMSEAAADDQDLALGKSYYVWKPYLIYVLIYCLSSLCNQFNQSNFIYSPCLIKIVLV